MFCTRWFIPLLVLPLPITPAYILILYILSTAMHAQACFNCMIVLTALFLSSCYWQPVPIDSPLYTPWSENVTTFSQALDTMLPANITIDKPHVIQLMDRCWCDISANVFFQPFNVTKWEEDSLQMYVDEVIKEHKEKLEAQVEGGAAPTEDTTPESEDTSPTPTTSLGLGNAIRSFFTKSPLASEPTVTPTPDLLTEVLSNHTHQIPEPVPPLPWYLRELSLRPYGFDVSFEWGWDGPHNT